MWTFLAVAAFSLAAWDFGRRWAARDGSVAERLDRLTGQVDSLASDVSGLEQGFLKVAPQVEGLVKKQRDQENRLNIQRENAERARKVAPVMQRLTGTRG